MRESSEKIITDSFIRSHGGSARTVYHTHKKQDRVHNNLSRTGITTMRLAPFGFLIHVMIWMSVAALLLVGAKIICTKSINFNPSILDGIVYE